MALVCTLGLASCTEEEKLTGHGHPHPVCYEVYQIPDVEKGQSVAQLLVTRWSDGTYDNPIIRFRGRESKTWQVVFFEKHPMSWEVQEIHPDGKVGVHVLQKIGSASYSQPLCAQPFERLNEFVKTDLE